MLVLPLLLPLAALLVPMALLAYIFDELGLMSGCGWTQTDISGCSLPSHRHAWDFCPGLSEKLIGEPKRKGCKEGLQNKYILYTLTLYLALTAMNDCQNQQSKMKPTLLPMIVLVSFNLNRSPMYCSSATRCHQSSEMTTLQHSADLL